MNPLSCLAVPSLDADDEQAVLRRNYRTDAMSIELRLPSGWSASIPEISQELTTPPLPLAEDTPSRARSLGRGAPTSRQRAVSVAGPVGPAANDDVEQAPVEPKKTYKRRKTRRDDLRCNKERLSISANEYREARHAYVEAYRLGLDLDTMVTLRPQVFEGMTLEDRWAWTKRWLNALRQLYADNDNLPEYAAVWGRESKRVGSKPPYKATGEHIHALVHTDGKRDILEATLRKRFDRYEVMVDPSTNKPRWLPSGWIVDGGTYPLKAVSPQVYRFNDTVPHRKSGPIFGPRVGWTKNINPNSRPRRSSAVKRTSSSEHLPAACRLCAT